MSACAISGASVPRGRSIATTKTHVRLRAQVGAAYIFGQEKRKRKMARSIGLEKKPRTGT